jgi:hypothetical protein
MERNRTVQTVDRIGSAHRCQIESVSNVSVIIGLAIYLLIILAKIWGCEVFLCEESPVQFHLTWAFCHYVMCNEEDDP